MPKRSVRSLATPGRWEVLLSTAVVLAVVALVTACVLWAGAEALADRGITAAMIFQGGAQPGAGAPTGSEN